MRALAQSAFAVPPEVIDLPAPEPGPGQVRVHVRAASVNGFDLAVASGALDGWMEHRFPLVLGKDFAGTVDALGEGVAGLSVGDRVLGVVNGAHLGEGSFAELVVVTVGDLAAMPEGLTYAQAASLGLAAATAQAVVDAAALARGQSVLVSGATGGVGTLVVQLAAHAGATVLATARGAEQRALVERIGAAQAVDYAADLGGAVHADHPGGVDVVIHLAGDAASLVGLVAAGGRFVSTLLQGPDQIDAPGVSVVPITAAPDARTLQRAAVDHLSGRAVAMVDRVVPLEEGADALAHVADGALGKTVIDLGGA